MKKTLPLIIVFGLLATAALYLWSGMDRPGGNTPGGAASPDALRFSADPGLILEYGEAGKVPEEMVGERVIFEAYRILFPENACSPEAESCEIDLRGADVEGTVVTPDGTERELGHETFYYLVPIYPVVQSGAYQFRVTMAGAPYEGAFTVPQGTFLEVTEAGTPNTFRIVSVQPGNEEGTVAPTRSAFGDAELAVHLLPDNAFLNLTQNEDGTVTASAEGLAQEGPHIFLLRKDGAWHSVAYFVPETE
jgi:hypothetical protein